MQFLAPNLSGLPPAVTKGRSTMPTLPELPLTSSGQQQCVVPNPVELRPTSSEQQFLVPNLSGLPPAVSKGRPTMPTLPKVPPTSSGQQQFVMPNLLELPPAIGESRKRKRAQGGGRQPVKTKRVRRQPKKHAQGGGRQPGGVPPPVKTKVASACHRARRRPKKQPKEEPKKHAQGGVPPPVKTKPVMKQPKKEQSAKQSAKQSPKQPKKQSQKAPQPTRSCQLCSKQTMRLSMHVRMWHMVGTFACPVDRCGFSVSDTCTKVESGFARHLNDTHCGLMSLTPEQRRVYEEYKKLKGAEMDGLIRECFPVVEVKSEVTKPKTKVPAVKPVKREVTKTKVPAVKSGKSTSNPSCQLCPKTKHPRIHDADTHVKKRHMVGTFVCPVEGCDFSVDGRYTKVENDCGMHFKHIHGGLKALTAEQRGVYEDYTKLKGAKKDDLIRKCFSGGEVKSKATKTVLSCKLCPGKKVHDTTHHVMNCHMDASILCPVEGCDFSVDGKYTKALSACASHFTSMHGGLKGLTEEQRRVYEDYKRTKRAEMNDLIRECFSGVETKGM